MSHTRQHRDRIVSIINGIAYGMASLAIIFGTMAVANLLIMIFC